MDFLGDVFEWIGDNWSKGVGGGIWHRSIEHLQISAVSLLIALVIALPPAVALGHVGRGGALAVNIANIGRALPSFAILVLALQITNEIGAVPTVIALVALAVPPIFTNTYVGLREVDAEIRESAAGMGMRGTQVLRRIEVPMALPLIMAGIRTSAVQVIATATLATLVGWGGLGYYIIVGLRLNDNVQVFGGALIVVVLALLVDLTLAGVQRLVVPRGLRASEPRWAVEAAVESEETEGEIVAAV
jgi:osmoprotectant transport system permease protein